MMELKHFEASNDSCVSWSHGTDQPCHSCDLDSSVLMLCNFVCFLPIQSHNSLTIVLPIKLPKNKNFLLLNIFIPVFKNCKLSLIYI